MIFKKRRRDENLLQLTSPPTFPVKKQTGDKVRGPMYSWTQPREMATCFSCAYVRKEEEYLFIPQGGLVGLRDSKGRKRIIICNHCISAFADALLEASGGDYYQAMYRLCAFTDAYYDDYLAHNIMTQEHTYEDGTKVSPYVSWAELYLLAIMQDPQLSKMHFYTSDNFVMEDVVRRQHAEGPVNLLSEQDKKNRRIILSIYHRDPFENEPLEDRLAMYEDLITMTDDSMADDLVRQKAAIEIIRTFNRIDKINYALSVLQSSPEMMAENVSEIKALIDQKKKETDMVTSFSKDHGFTERYANAKSKGSGTLGAIIRDMDDAGYDKGAINKFDVDTAAAIKQVSDISAESIFRQLTLSATDFANVVKEQGEYIREMQATMEAQAEELRLLKEKQMKGELLDEYRMELQKKELDPEEIEELVKAQLDYVPSTVGNTFYSADVAQAVAEQHGKKVIPK